MKGQFYFKLAFALFCLILATQLFALVKAQTHDVTVVKITAYPTSIPKGDPVYISVTVKNNGTVPESFDVYVYADGRHPPFGDEYVLPKQTVSNLPSGEDTILNFVWDTSDVTPGSYTISAYAPLPDDVHPNDNFLKGPIVGGVYEPIKRTQSNLVLNLSLPFVILTVFVAGVIAVSFFKKLGSEKPLLL